MEYIQRLREVELRPMNEAEKSAYRAQIYPTVEDETKWRIPVFPEDKKKESDNTGAIVGGIIGGMEGGVDGAIEGALIGSLIDD